MMEFTQERKKKTHTKIVKTASRLFRRDGYRGAGVDKVMKTAGLTVGGFYAHFPSKDALLVEALQTTMAEGRPLAYEIGMDNLSPREWMTEVMDRLLSPTQRKNRERGCPLAALINEVARAPLAVRKQYETEVLKNLEVMAPRTGGRKSEVQRQNAIFFLTVLMGAINLARALPSEELAEEVLLAAKESMLKWVESFDGE